MQNKSKSLSHSLSYVVKISGRLSYALLNFLISIHLNKWKNGQNTFMHIKKSCQHSSINRPRHTCCSHVAADWQALSHVSPSGLMNNNRRSIRRTAWLRKAAKCSRLSVCLCLATSLSVWHTHTRTDALHQPITLLSLHIRVFKAASLQIMSNRVHKFGVLGRRGD